MKTRKAFLISALDAVSEKKRLNTTGLDNAGCSISHNPIDLHGLLRG
jgi:hypothetical protein